MYSSLTKPRRVDANGRRDVMGKCSVCSVQLRVYMSIQEVRLYVWVCV